MDKEQIVLESVLAEFQEIAKIPRPSGHEEKISAYLFNRIKAMGLDVVQDEKLNIIADKPASPGYEAVARTVLQAHMDMVCVADEGVAFDPLTDAITVERNEKHLYAAGTSLGADDGMGVAQILYILQADFLHGPLRAIITVDEEQGMTGAISLADKYLLDAAYVINCDSEDYDVVTVGSAGNLVIDFEKEPAWEVPVAEAAYCISLTGLLGGHSGEAINCGRGNAIQLLALALRELLGAGIVFSLATFEGGMARNAIPAKAVATITAAPDCLPLIRQVLHQAEADFKNSYRVENGLKFVVETVALPQRVLLPVDCDGFLGLLCVLHSGIYAMSQSLPGLVETSANIGRAVIQPDKIKIEFLPRSASDATVHSFRLIAAAAAGLAGFRAKYGSQSPGWAENPASRLQPLLSTVFAEQNKKTMKVESIHAGLECGWFFQKNPKLDIVSIGVTAHDIHSPQERIELATIVPQVHLIMEVLTRLKNE